MRYFWRLLITFFLFLTFCLGSFEYVNPDYSKTPVFFVHGYGLSAGSWNSLINYLQNSGYPNQYLRAIQLVPTHGGNINAAKNQIAPAIEGFLKEINDFLSANYPQNPKKTKVDLVSHSMGGLSSRWYAARISPKKVNKWISLAGANHGTNDLCGWGTDGADDLCPAYAPNELESYIQYQLNGVPYEADVDETPYGEGLDSIGTISVFPDRNRRIFYYTIRTVNDEWISPDSSVLVDGAGGFFIQIPKNLPANETSPGNIKIKNGVRHDPMLSDMDTMRLVNIILDVDIGLLPSTPQNPSPKNRAIDIPIETELDWADSIGAESYDVYFGTFSPPPYYRDTISSHYELPPLDSSTTYYWRVVAKNSYGNTSSPKWTFITMEPDQKYLRINVSQGGSTDPKPGKYFFEFGTNVTVKAIPNSGYQFYEWSGDVKGIKNPITIIIDSDKTIRANFVHAIYPPLDFSGEKVTNRSLLQVEYINFLSWQANPNNVNIRKYRIYAIQGQSQSLLIELDASILNYWHRRVDKDKQYTYAIVAVNDENREGEWAYVTVR